MFFSGCFLVEISPLKLNVCLIFLEDVNFFMTEQTYNFSIGSNKPVFHCVQSIEQIQLRSTVNVFESVLLKKDNDNSGGLTLHSNLVE